MKKVSLKDKIFWGNSYLESYENTPFHVQVHTIPRYLLTIGIQQFHLSPP